MNIARAKEPLGASSFKSVPDMWHHRVASTPATEAMTYRDASGQWAHMTWGQAGARVRTLSNALLAFGLKAEQRCCIVSETRVEWILCDLAILCAGGATTTVFPSNTEAECAFIINDCDAVLVFAENQLQVDKLTSIRDQIPQVTKVVVIDGEASEDGWVTPFADFEASGEAWAEANPDRYEEAHKNIEPDRLATLMYTSGTTGNPKGVMLTHDAWVYEGEALDALAILSPADRQYLFLPLAHVFAKVLQVSFIRLGIPTVVDGDTKNLLANLRETRPTFMGGVPRIFERAFNAIVSEAEDAGGLRHSVFRWAIEVGSRVSQLRQENKGINPVLRAQFNLADRLVYSKVKEAFGGRLRFFISGGAPLSKELAEFFHSCDILILEGYGLTESSAASCVNRPDDFKFGTVGPPLPGCEIRVAEDGEILLKSRGVMKGYYNLPEASAEHLTDDGWLMTGDIGLILPTGHIKITDRKKDLIITAGGKNVAPANFENRLKAASTYVGQVVMHGDRRNFCSALIAINEDTVGAWARRENVPYADYASLAAHPKVVELIQGVVDEVNRQVPGYERVRKIALLPEPISEDNGMLTPSLKVKRRVVEKHYADLLDSFYQGSLKSL